MAKRSLKPWHETVRRINQRMQRLPVELAERVASVAVEDFSRYAREDFHAGRTAYSEPRPRGVDGRQLTLRASDDTLKSLTFKRIGTVIRASLGTRYAPYLIGRYGILPNGRVPAKWSNRIRAIVADAEREDRS